MQTALFDQATLEAKFQEFHSDNPKVYEELLALANQARSRGRHRIGIGMLFEVLRWNRYLTTTDPDFKLNNNYRSRYARLLMDNHPELQGLFETRELKS